MISIALFAEDLAHQEVVKPMIEKISRSLGIDVRVSVRSAQGGSGRVGGELERYLRDIRKGKESGSDLLVVATDSNCRGYSERKKEFTSILRSGAPVWVFAIPDPHIERWLLLDSSAFKKVLGKGCDPPPSKCKRDLFKSLLRNAVRNAGIKPTIGGIEYAEDLVAEMNMKAAARADPSLGHFYNDLIGALQRLQTSQSSPSSD